MRLLILLNGRFPTEKAYGLQVMAMVRGCVEAGIQVAVAYPRRSKDEPQQMEGVHYFPFGPYSPIVVPWLFPLHRLLGLVGLRRIADEFKPDVVLANDPLQAAFFPRPWKVAWDLHDLPNLDRGARRWLIRRVLQRVSAIVSTNEIKLAHLQETFGAIPTSIVLRNPVTFDPDVYRSIPHTEARRRVAIGEGEFAVVYAGQLFSWKGTDTLIAAAEYLTDPVTIHIVGGLGRDLERSKILARNLSVGSDRIVFHGQRPAEDIPAWLRAANIVVIPNTAKERISLEDTNPLKLYEAFAAQAAIVASDIPSIREAAGGAVVYFVPPDDPQALAEKILELSTQARYWSDLRTGPGGSSQMLTAKMRVTQMSEFFSML